MQRFKNQRMTNENGFTLVEVLASVVILSIVMMGVLNLLIFTNKNAVANNERLVAINLAKATIERMKVKPDYYFDPGIVTPAGITAEVEQRVNSEDYKIIVFASQHEHNEKPLGLINVHVTVELPTKNVKSEVEGYVRHD